MGACACRDGAHRGWRTVVEGSGLLRRIDRVQLAVPDRAAAARGWVELLGAEHESDDRLAGSGALRARYRLGSGFVELLEPDGSGPLADAVAKRGGHLYAAGASTDDLAGVVSLLRARGIDVTTEGGQAFVDPAAVGEVGFRVVLSPDEDLEPVGDLDFFYEATLLVADAESAAGSAARQSTKWQQR